MYEIFGEKDLKELIQLEKENEEWSELYDSDLDNEYYCEMEEKSTDKVVKKIDEIIVKFYKKLGSRERSATISLQEIFDEFLGYR